jgi:hypothetical protein
VTNRDLIIPLATRYGVPAVSNNPIYGESGALISYGVDFTELFRQAAGYIDRIFKGAAPADLPVQNPTKFEVVINFKTAKRLGLNTAIATRHRRQANRIGRFLLQCMSPLMAQSRHSGRRSECPLSGAMRTLTLAPVPRRFSHGLQPPQA